ncbi:MAG: ATP-binding cassette domain-containing protein [Magnetococcales bacterium]|nr:ATP-binding cassette domain-containing protein [Magnetococcales bacterium]
MSDLMIEISALTRRFGPTLALDGIDLNVRRGEVMGFLGPNGAGKTTTMRILAGLLAPTSGTARITGLDILNNPEKSRARIGYLPETPPIYKEMTVREYLAFIAALRGVTAKSVKSAVTNVMGRCGLEQVAGRLLGNLSKGYRQRSGIAQALVHNPSVVILDEPTVGLDPIQIREIRTLIRDLGGDHSVLLSTHILSEVKMTCDRVAVINKGRLITEDTLEGLEQRAKQAKEFRIQLNNPPDEATLRALPGVAHLSAQESGAWLLVPKPEADPIPTLLEKAVTEGWGLRELSPNSHSLEEIFVNLTTDDSETESQERPVDQEEAA